MLVAEKAWEAAEANARAVAVDHLDAEQRNRMRRARRALDLALDPRHRPPIGTPWAGSSTVMPDVCQADIVRATWRRWLSGPKHGLARGAAVFGSAGFDHPDQLLNHFAQCTALRSWAGSRGIVLDDTCESLTTLDLLLDTGGTGPDIEGASVPLPPPTSSAVRASSRPGFDPPLAKEVGQYLGTVIVRCVPGAAWHVWPNGHPVVRLPSAKDVDVIAEVDRRLRSHEGTLMSIYTTAR